MHLILTLLVYCILIPFSGVEEFLPTYDTGIVYFFVSFHTVFFLHNVQFFELSYLFLDSLCFDFRKSFSALFLFKFLARRE